MPHAVSVTSLWQKSTLPRSTRDELAVALQHANVNEPHLEEPIRQLFSAITDSRLLNMALPKTENVQRLLAVVASDSDPNQKIREMLEIRKNMSNTRIVGEDRKAAPTPENVEGAIARKLDACFRNLYSAIITRDSQTLHFNPRTNPQRVRS